MVGVVSVYDTLGWLPEQGVWLMSESGTRKRTHLCRVCAAGLAVALLVFYPYAGMYQAQAATPGDGSSAQVRAAMDEEIGKLPDEMLPESVDDSIPDDATVVAKNIVVTQQGEIKDIETGEPITDQEVVGTVDHPADPLAKTGGRSFIPVPVKDVKEQVDQSEQTRTTHPTANHQTGIGRRAGVRSGVYHPQGHSGTGVVPAALGNNGYGAHWGTYNGSPAFFEGNGALFVQQAKGVIDVSQWQGRIDWAAVRNSGVEGAIIRLGYGWGNGLDTTAQYNIRECKRLGIPFGVYVYSYAYDSNTAWAEGDNTVDLLRKAGVGPGDLAYPVYYDLEKWSWKGHIPPTSPGVYDGIVNSWYNRLQSAGYGKLSIYSYTSYLNTALNSGTIRSRTNWVASYGSRTGFNFPANQRCWQYADNGRVRGISGDVDLNACGNKDAVSGGTVGLPASDRLTDIIEGDYFIGSALPDRYLDIAGGNHQDGLPVETWSPTNGLNQLYHIKPVGGGAYTIVSTISGKAFDVTGASMANGNTVIQYTPHSGINQRWFFYKAKDGYIFIVSALGNGRSAVLDVTKGSTALGTKLEIWEYNGGPNQAFRLMQTTGIPSGKRTLTNSYAHGNSLDIRAVSTAPEAVLQTWQPNNGNNQRFVFRDRGNGRYNIGVAHSGMYLDIQYGYQGECGNIIQFPLTGGTNQLWYLQKYPGGYAIRSMSNNKAIDIYGADTNPGARVISYSYRGQPNQKWIIN